MNDTSLTHFNLNDWLHESPYKNGTLAEELQCYGLPYGGIGFASHILTYYTIIMLSYQRSPWMPWKRNHHKWVDITLSIFGLVATIILTVLTILRCRNRWQFVVMATWKLILSITFGILSFHAATMVRPREKHQYSGLGHLESTANAIEKKEYTKVLWWLLLYVPGVVAGLAGLLSLVFKEIGHNADVKIITEVFGAVIAFPAGLMLIIGIIVLFSQCCGSREKAEVNNSSMENLGRSTVVISIMVCLVAAGATSVLAALYSDWILGAIAGNLVGLPSGDIAPLYWGYILAKRLPFFSF
ncbi:hypothetical protein N431DRAFT_438524 [Stipitochalara longipes BDJ]|nr:hypothetical protein N431DRAFT_438524 [Stipitochalara longipes BDJ]